MASARVVKGWWIGPPDFFDSRLESLALRLPNRPVPLDSYREPILFFVQNLSQHRDPTIQPITDGHGLVLSSSPSTFVPDADVVTDAELLWLFFQEWEHYRDLGTEGPEGTPDFGADDPFARGFDLKLCAENVAALVRELVNRFPPAKSYSKSEYVHWLEEVVRLSPPAEVDGQ